MKRLFHCLCLLFALSIVASTVTFIMHSCQQDDSAGTFASGKNTASNFLELCMGSKDDLMHVRIADVRASRAIDWGVLPPGTDPNPKPPGTRIDTVKKTWIYIDAPEGSDGEAAKGRDYAIKTVEDLMRLQHEYAVELGMEKGSETIDSIAVTDEDAVWALEPLVTRSRDYLMKKGFTQAEINKMIKDEGATEQDLVTLVLTVATDEADQTTAYVRTMSPYWSILATPCYAGPSNLSMSVVKRCLMHAVLGGIEETLLHGWIESRAVKVWTKAAIKSLLKTVAKKSLGPVGVALAVAEFSYCVYTEGGYTVHL